MAKYLETKSGSIEEAIKQVNEKSVSQAQQKAAGAALSAKRGEISPSELVGASKEMYDGMTEKELEDFAKTKHKDLPKKVEEDYYNVIYKDKKGKVEGERAFKDKNQAQRYADGGNKKDKVGGTYNVVKVKGRMEALDKVNPDAVKKKFDDRKDKDIDNDGDVDSSDKYLHKRRKAISKAVAQVKEEKDMEQIQEMIDKNPRNKDDGYDPVVNVRGIGKMRREEIRDKMQELIDQMDELRFKMHKEEHDNTMKYLKHDTSGSHNPKLDDDMIKLCQKLQTLADARKQVYKIYFSPQYKKKLQSLREEKDLKEYNEIGTPEYTKHTLDVTPGQSEKEWEEQVGVMQQKTQTMREALAKVWGMKEGKNPFKKEEEEKPLKKTMTGDKPTKVEVEPKIKQ